MAKFLKLYDSNGMTMFCCDNGNKYRAIEILDNVKTYALYVNGQKRKLHVDAYGGDHYVHAMAVVCNPDYATSYPELFPAAYDDAFKTLWEKGEALYERV